jgi:predicted AAA+ superfamily ATPase
MISKETLKDIIVSNEKFIDSIKDIVGREKLAFPQKLKKVVVFYGVRRSGKTYCLFDVFKQNRDRALYIDFEDERLGSFKAEDFQKLEESILELNLNLIGQELVFLLDEIQNVTGWEKFARRAVEMGDIKVFVTGSSSKMTPRQFHTSLRGRSWGIGMFPFSFREYLALKGIDNEIKNIFYGKKQFIIKKYFSEYLKWGGFPEVCFLESVVEKRKVINEYLEAIFFKDLVERFKINNIYLLDALRDKLFSSFALKLSLSAFYKQYKDKFAFSKDSLFSYYKNFLESLIVFEVRKFSPSSYKRLRNPAKIYLVDSGLSRKVATNDFGRQLENVVFLELQRRNQEIFYFEEEGECDFIAKDEEGKSFPFQVSWEITAENANREYEGLVKACNFLGIKNGMLLTYDEEMKVKKHGVQIEVLPVWKWLIISKAD